MSQKRQFKRHVIIELPHTIYSNIYFFTSQKFQSLQENPKRTFEKLHILHIKYTVLNSLIMIPE